ncbi:MAG: glutathione S-transferase [Gammaproteobacteria bacterium]|nr:glutathione S-transferase [Gammaproteobacteria bacterium]
MALHISEAEFEYREITLRNKPPTMIAASPKATVPVLVLGDGTVLDESLDILFWALEKNDPHNWLGNDRGYVKPAMEIIEKNDGPFKHHLDRYKYADRHPELSQQGHRDNCLFFLTMLEARLQKHPYLLANQITVADIAILSFIRQFAFVDKVWFDSAQYPHLQQWLETLLSMRLFQFTMEKRSLWEF